MFLAVGWCLAFKMKARLLGAGRIRATPAVHVHHAVQSMLLAVRRSLAALDVKVRMFRAQGMRATPANDIDHVILSMLLAEHGRLTALNIESWCCRTGVM